MKSSEFRESFGKTETVETTEISLQTRESFHLKINLSKIISPFFHEFPN